ncbi:AAA family ATPase [Falsirhodobacter sp. 1013]|uniref:AAA family ATPase n=1 Tax=Falsirhodobacter sp. 1013 TaxID=3417566 RepID=UPI003EC09860
MRLQAFWRRMREVKAGPAPDVTTKPDGTLHSVKLEAWTDQLIMPHAVSSKIIRRANSLEAAYRRSGQLFHLTDKEREALQSVRTGVSLMRIDTEHQADEIAAAVHDEYPWMAEATDALWQDLRRSVRRGDAGFRFTPILLDGPPGIGKSSWARYVAGQVRVPSLAIDASAEAAGFGIVGVQRGWSSAQSGQPVALILREHVGNPMVVIDEIDKTGTIHGASGVAHSLQNSLLPLLEPSTAKAWTCPFYRVSMDMSWISWILTANDAGLVPTPLRSRCRELRLRRLTTAELVAITLREQRRRGLSDPATEGIVGALQETASSPVQPDLRILSRMLDLAERHDALPMVH